MKNISIFKLVNGTESNCHLQLHKLLKVQPERYWLERWKYIFLEQMSGSCVLSAIYDIF